MIIYRRYHVAEKGAGALTFILESRLTPKSHKNSIACPSPPSSDLNVQPKTPTWQQDNQANKILHRAEMGPP